MIKIENQGRLVSINNDFMNVYEIGQGDKTLVFLSGGLTASPILDFKLLYSNLKEDFKIVVIEKFGYGFSSDSENSREIDKMLEETRIALSSMEVKPPFILVSHSMSGIEALYWFKKYPEEVSTIIGLDMATYEAYENLKVNLWGLKLNRVLVRSGVAKLFPKSTESDAVKYGNLTQDEKEMSQQLFYKNFTSKATLNEVIQIKPNSVKVKNINIKNLPILVLVSNGQGTGIKRDKWLRIQENLMNASQYGKIVYYDCPHYLHNHKADEITKEIKLFIEKEII